eukprot:UN10396
MEEQKARQQQQQMLEFSQYYDARYDIKNGPQIGAPYHRGEFIPTGQILGHLLESHQQSGGIVNNNNGLVQW